MEAVAEIEEFDMSSFTPMLCDLNDFDCVRNFCDEVVKFANEKPVDRVVCNAAVYQPSLDYPKYSKDDIEQQMQSNFLSHFLMVSRLMPHMAGSSGATQTLLNFLFRRAGRTASAGNVPHGSRYQHKAERRASCTRATRLRAALLLSSSIALPQSSPLGFRRAHTAHPTSALLCTRISLLYLSTWASLLPLRCPACSIPLCSTARTGAGVARQLAASILR